MRETLGISALAFALIVCFVVNLMKQKTLVYFLLFTLVASLGAEVRLPKFFTNNMVLQRDIPVRVWGWTNAGESVAVKFGSQTKNTTAGSDGKWSVQLDAMPANATPQVLEVNGMRLKNILVGDVWICSGQSNMEWTVQNSMNYKKEAAVANYPEIRHIKFAHLAGDVPLDDVERIE